MKPRVPLDQLWHNAVPFAACVLLFFVWGVDFGWGLLTLAALSLAAAVVVGKVGTAACSLDELRAAQQVARW